MDTLPVDVLMLIASRMDVRSIVHFGCVNRVMHFVCKDMFTYTSVLLSKKITSNTNRVLSTVVFRHRDSLRSVQDIERWSRYALSVNDPLLMIRVREAILRHIKLTWFPFNKQISITDEQLSIVNCAPSPNKTILVQAYAGTGKTSTLYQYAKIRPLSTILYIAYNTSLANETSRRFQDLPLVHVRTMHSWALSEYDVEIGEFSVREARIIFPSLDDAGAQKVLYEFEKYCSSDRLDDGGWRVQGIWRAMFHDQRIPVSHDAYLKAFQLRQITTTSYDIVMIDEVQDFNNCMLSIICRLQDTCKLFVGDVHQQIYSFKHVERPFAYIIDKQTTDVHLFRLTRTFRFGYDLMNFTNLFMKIKFGASGFTQCAVANTDVLRTIPNHFDLPKNATFLSRYHITLYNTMFALAEQRLWFHIHDKHIDFDDEIMAMNDLANFDDPVYLKHNALLDGYASLTDFMSAVKTLRLDVWGLRLNLWVKHGTTIFDKLQNAKKWYSYGNGIKLLTAHQSKGLEFETVILSQDLRFDDPESANLFYVALTRATKTVHIPTNVVNYVFSKRAHLSYTNHPLYRPGLCSRCKRSTNRSILIECDPDVVINNTCEVLVCEPLCGKCM